MSCIGSEPPMKPWKPAGSGPAASSSGTEASAFSTAESSRTSSKGLTRKSKAPARIACTARLIEPLAVMTMVRVSGASRRSVASRSSPSPSGSCRSSSTSDGRVRSQWARASARLKAQATPCPDLVSTER